MGFPRQDRFFAQKQQRHVGSCRRFRCRHAVGLEPALGAVAGSIVVDGVVRRSAPIRVLRDNVVIYEGELESLRRFKDPVEEVRMGTECGIAVKNYNDVKPGDQIEVFERIEVARSID